MKVKLTQDQLRQLKSMNAYWKEISKRPVMLSDINQEIRQLASVVKAIDILLICGEYAENYTV